MLFSEELSIAKDKRDKPQNSTDPSPSKGLPKWCTMELLAHNVENKEKRPKPKKINV